MLLREAALNSLLLFVSAAGTVQISDSTHTTRVGHTFDFFAFFVGAASSSSAGYSRSSSSSDP